jgi:hypothetical protein
MDVSKLRGNPDISKSIFKKVHSISENTDSPIGKPSSVVMGVDGGGGAYASIMKKRTPPAHTQFYKNDPKPLVHESGTSGFEKDTIKRIDLGMYFDTLFESLTLLKENKDYSTVVRGLLTYYLAGNLDRYVIEGVCEDDKQEIMGIIKEFERSVKNVLR